MDQNSIKSFSVYGLFGTDDVHIPFEENTKILIGENGLGKTQILNIFYYTLTRNLSKLIEFTFDKVELKFGNETIEIVKEKIAKYLQDDENLQNIYYNQSIVKELITLLGGVLNFERLKDAAENLPAFEIKRLLARSSYAHRLTRIAPIEDFADLLSENRQKNALSFELVQSVNKIESIFSNKVILYFPTFRRVEEDLHNLGYDEDYFLLDNEDNRLIHFGMDDVQNSFNTIEKEIDVLLKEGFTKISGEILSKLIKGFGDTNLEILNGINETDIDIILARVGDQISETDKSRIREIVLKKEISSTDNSLFYFIQILIDIYDKQKKFDNSINQFKEVCINYLIGKKVVYDESDIKIYIKSDSSSEPLPLNKLSSGEKQIISIFSKIYLSEDDQRFIVLFDEPELSLSMIWQKKLLPDILNSKKCNFLLAVTHSPFIFDNELDRYAVGLNEYVKPQEKVTA
jgi:predicted ATP-dependent endonuclease of OLD family